MENSSEIVYMQKMVCAMKQAGTGTSSPSHIFFNLQLGGITHNKL